ncbi:unnamed protein product [Scytosiphon promiscuus]
MRMGFRSVRRVRVPTPCPAVPPPSLVPGGCGRRDCAQPRKSRNRKIRGKILQSVMGVTAVAEIRRVALCSFHRIWPTRFHDLCSVQGGEGGRGRRWRIYCCRGCFLYLQELPPFRRD